MPKKNIERDTRGLAHANRDQHGLAKWMDVPLLLGTPEDVVPRALQQMDDREQDHFRNLADDIQASYPGISNLMAAHMALASMVMERATAFAFRRGLGDMNEANVAALEWARKVYTQNVNQIAKDFDSPERESNWMRDLDEFELTRETRPDGTVTERVKGTKRRRVADVQVVDVEPDPGIDAATDEDRQEASEED